MTTSTNDDKGVTATSTGVAGRFSAVEITTGALTLDDAVSGFINERGRLVPMGEWTSVPYAAGNFLAGSGRTWTVESGDVVTLAYALVGLTLKLSFWLQTTSVSGSAAWLGIVIPGGYTAALTTAGVLAYSDNGNAAATGHIEIPHNDSVIYCFKAGAVAWSASTNLTVLLGQVDIPINSPGIPAGTPESPGSHVAP